MSKVRPEIIDIIRMMDKTRLYFTSKCFVMLDDIDGEKEYVFIYSSDWKGKKLKVFAFYDEKNCEVKLRADYGEFSISDFENIMLELLAMGDLGGRIVRH